jgi:DNA transformation protein
MAWSREFRDFVLDQLAALGNVKARSMFGGVGIYSETLMFALIADDQLYFRIDEQTRARFAAAGQTPFTYDGRGKTAGRVIEMPYYSVSLEVLEDPTEAVDWARDAVAAAERAKRK